MRRSTNGWGSLLRTNVYSESLISKIIHTDIIVVRGHHSCIIVVRGHQLQKSIYHLVVVSSEWDCGDWLLESVEAFSNLILFNDGLKKV